LSYLELIRNRMLCKQHEEVLWNYDEHNKLKSRFWWQTDLQMNEGMIRRREAILGAVRRRVVMTLESILVVV
jgi:hypothetical protein